MKQILMSIIILFSLISCSEKPKEVIKVGYTSWIGYYPLVLAHKKAYFDESIEVHEMPNSSESKRLFRNGLLDMVALTLDETFSLYEEDKDIAVIFLIDHSIGGDVVLGGEGIKSLEDIRGKKIGYESGAIGAMMMAKLLEKSNMSLKDVEVEQVLYHEHLQAFEDKKIDVVITYEPVGSLLKEQGANLLLDSSQTPNIIFDVLVVKKSFLKENTQRIQSFVSAWFKAVSLMNDVSKPLPNIYNYNSKELRKMKQGIELLSLKRNLELYENKKIIKASKNILKILNKYDIVNARYFDLDLSQLFDDRFVKGAKK